MSFVDKQIQKIACDIGSVSPLCCGDCEKCHKDPTDDSCNFIIYARRLREREYRPPYKGTVTISEEMFKELMCQTDELKWYKETLYIRNGAMAQNLAQDYKKHVTEKLKGVKQ